MVLFSLSNPLYSPTCLTMSLYIIILIYIYVICIYIASPTGICMFVYIIRVLFSWFMINRQKNRERKQAGNNVLHFMLSWQLIKKKILVSALFASSTVLQNNTEIFHILLHSFVNFFIFCTTSLNYFYDQKKNTFNNNTTPKKSLGVNREW